MPRKTTAARERMTGQIRASMRPRPDAAENPAVAGDGNDDFASMRPRPDAAENRPADADAQRTPARRFNEAAARCRGKRTATGSGRPETVRFNEAAARCRGKLRHVRRDRHEREASMRPRPDAAENVGGRVRPAGSRNAASMRPRPDAAENFKTEYRLDAAIPASMRPRPDAAENYGCQRQPRPRTPRFNEAAARCRGKRARPPARRGRARRFNEAAARCRGKPGLGNRAGHLQGALQ